MQVYDSTADEAKSWQMGLPGGHAEYGSTTGMLSKLLRSWVGGQTIRWSWWFTNPPKIMVVHQPTSPWKMGIMG